MVDVICGQSYSWFRDREGYLYQCGISYGIIPECFNPRIKHRKVVGSYLGSSGLAIDDATGLVSWIRQGGLDSICANSTQLLYGEDIALRNETYGLVIQATSQELVEVGDSSPLMSSTNLKLLGQVSRVFSSPSYGACICKPSVMIYT
jgi:hypothetical protein